MKRALIVSVVLPGFLLATLALKAVAASPLLIGHNDVDIAALSSNQINRAKAVLHIGYGHTSHGSQLTTGMSGLVGFANGGGKGMAHANDIFAFNNGGSGGALDLQEGGGLNGDCGYYPQWYNNTVNYLDDPSHADVNVVIWSWCGQMPGKYSNGTLTNEYLVPMSLLEDSYPNVVFVYMTGHVDIWDDADQKAACQVIRDYCAANNKVLYDFPDIEHYDPDGNFYEFVEDDCDYYSGAGTGKLGNWATEWQGTHTEGIDWYSCTSAHSQPLNANQKAYAAWALWCALAEDLDRDGIADEWEERYGGCNLFGEGGHDQDGDGSTDYAEFVADTNPTNPASSLRIGDVAVDGGTSVVQFDSSADRVYGLEWSSNLVDGGWVGVAGQTNKPGSGGSMSLTGTSANASSFYRVEVAIP